MAKYTSKLISFGNEAEKIVRYLNEHPEED